MAIAAAEIDELRAALQVAGPQRDLFEQLVVVPGAFVPTATSVPAITDRIYLARVTQHLAAKLRRQGYDIHVHRILGRALVSIGNPRPILGDDDRRPVDRAPGPAAFTALARLKASAGRAVEIVSR